MTAMEPVLDIPEPEPSDSETVASSLETAAIFGAKGDRQEALRWVQRAVEFAGESGDDLRTLALAHTVATLSSRLNGAAESAPNAPTPPSRTSSSPTLTVEREEDATPLTLDSLPHPAPPSSSPSATSTPPLPPSARARPPTSVSVKPSVQPSMPAAPKSVSPSPPAVSKSTLSPAGVTTPPTTASNGASNGSRPAAKSLIPSFLSTSPAAASGPKSPPPLPTSAAASVAPTGRRARQAARVSVTRSLTERGLYFVRVLEEDQGCPDDAFEAMLVSNDPSQNLV
jgi:hypothetical protein